MLAPPQRLKQGVAKAQCKQVLHRRFAQVVVNAKHLLFLKKPAHRVVDSAVGRQVVAQRFFQHHAGVRCVQARSGELFAHGGKQRGRGGHVHHHSVGLARLQAGGQRGVVCRLGQVHAHIFQQRGKTLKLFQAGAFGEFNLVKTRLDQRAVLFVRLAVAPHADDAPALGQRAVAKGLEQGGHQLAPHQVASAAKQNKVEAHTGLKEEGLLISYIIYAPIM